MNETEILIVILKSVVVFALTAGAVPFIVWMERKVSADFQFRVGPNRIGPWGIFQTLLDAVKLIFKEQFAPKGADSLLYYVAPVLTFLAGIMTAALLPIAVLQSGAVRIPLSVASPDLGLIVFLAISSLTSYGLAYAGWSSGNQYALLGGIRSCAQLISYEVVIALAVLSILMISGTLNLNTIVEEQNTTMLFGSLPRWNIFIQPFTFLLFLIAAFAETNRAPFDLPEAEQELVGGYHTEYSGVRYAWFMLGEYAALLNMSGLIVTLFFGGWSLPYITEHLPDGILSVFISFAIYVVKVVLFIFFVMWIRWTLPRLRWDQLMKLAWRRLIPIGIANLFLTAYLFMN